MSTWHSIKKFTQTISSKIRNKIKIPTLATFIQHSIGSLSHNNQTEGRKTKKKKERKGIQIEKEGIKLSLFIDDMILYIYKNSKDTCKKNC